MKLQWKNKLQRTVMAGVFAALLVVLSQVSIPLPTGIPVTLQTFAVALCGCVLGPAVGSAAVGVYLALGAVGVPVFAGFSGGAGALVGMTGGYLWACLPVAFLCGVGAQPKSEVLAVAGGLAVGFQPGQSLSPSQAGERQRELTESHGGSVVSGCRWRKAGLCSWGLFQRLRAQRFV